MLTKLITLKSVRIVVELLVGIFAIASFFWGIKQYKDSKKWQNNFEITTSRLDSTRDKNGVLMVETQSLTLKIKDLERMSENGNETIKKLLVELNNSYLKQRKVTSMSNLTLESLYKFRPDLIDSLIITKHDTIIDSIKTPVEKYKDEWIEYIRIIKNNKPEVSIKTKNDIVLYKSWYKEGFILWRWLKAKEWKYTVKDLNPYSKINSFNVIDLGKAK